jgi:hypothetical protein
MKVKSSEIKEKLSNSLHIRIIHSSFGEFLKAFQAEYASVKLLSNESE